MERNVHIGNEWWKIMTIYGRDEKIIRGLVENTIKENREDCMLLGKDFNRRTGEREARNWEQERRDGKRKSKDKDKVENAEGKRLMEWNEENGWEVLNGDTQGDEEGEGVIDYGRANEEAWERVEEFRIGERVESNHLPLEIYTYRRNEPGRKRKRKNKVGAEEDNKKYGITKE
jgi:hypothetical protein